MGAKCLWDRSGYYEIDSFSSHEGVSFSGLEIMGKGKAEAGGGQPDLNVNPLGQSGDNSPQEKRQNLSPLSVTKAEVF